MSCCQSLDAFSRAQSVTNAFGGRADPLGELQRSPKSPSRNRGRSPTSEGEGRGGIGKGRVRYREGEGKEDVG